MKRHRLLLAVLLAAGCSFFEDFNDIEGLPCPCDPNHVCLLGSKTCFRRHTVDNFKSCDINAEMPDDLCPQNSICQSVNGNGMRCLPTCTVSTYATPESSRNISAQCPQGTTCWGSERGGVCSEGICNDIPNDCTAPQECVRFNGAGVCFSPCAIFQTNPLPCAGGQICHPVGDTNKTQCIQPGKRNRNELCTDTDMCKQVDEFNRPLVCAGPVNSMELRRCRAICHCPADGSACENASCNSGAPCVLAVQDVDITTHEGLGICLE